MKPWLPFSALARWLGIRPLKHPRTSYTFDGTTLTAHGFLTRPSSLRIEEIQEIGIETTDTGPFVEDVFWLLNRETDPFRIPQESPVFQALMARFESFENFDWKSFTDAMACTESHYFLCSRRAPDTHSERLR